MSSANCVSCLTNLPILSLYQCHTCSTEQKEASSAETLCEDCLVPHLRKDHSIVDSKGNEPLACTTHKFLFSVFCKTCDVLFCCKCSAQHMKHDCETIGKKATEIRTQVFNLLTDLENKEKPLRVKNESISNLVEKNAEEANQFSAFVREQCKKLENSILQDIEEKSKSNELQRHTLSTACVKLVETQQSLRKLLSGSNSKLIQTCATDLTKADELIKLCDEIVQQREQTISFISEEAAKQKFETFGKEINLASKTVRKPNFFNIVNRREKLRIVDCGSNPKEVKKLLTDKEKGDIKLQLCSRIEKSSLITHAFPLFDDTTSFIVLFTDKSVKQIRIHDFLNFPACPYPAYPYPACPYPENENFLWPYFSLDSLKFCWSYWDSEKSMVKFTHNKDFFISCNKCPKINMTSSIPGYLCFIDENDKRILLFAINSGSLIEIELEQLQMESVDCVSVIAADEICVWSITSKKLQLLRKRDPELPTFSLFGISFSWENERLFIATSSNLHSYTMIPKIRKAGVQLEDHLFAISREIKEQPKAAIVKNLCECDKCGKVLKNPKGVENHKRSKHADG